MKYERRALMEIVTEQRDANRAEIERKRLEREADPIAYDNWIRSADPVANAGLVFKDHENSASTHQFSEPMVGDFTEAQADGICELVVTYYKRANKKREQAIQQSVAPLHERLTRLEGKVDALLASMEQRANSGETNRNTIVLKFIENERRERDNVIAALKAEIAHLRGKLEALSHQFWNFKP
jgi:hypothetical protein